MVVHLKSIVFTCLGLLLLTGCQKENKDTSTASPPPLTDEQMILGEWEWEFSIPFGWGADPTDTIFAHSADRDTWLLYDPDSVTTFTYYHNLDTLVIYRDPYQFDVTFNGVDSVKKLNGVQYHITPDTLVLDRRPNDGSYQLFLKKNTP